MAEEKTPLPGQQEEYEPDLITLEDEEGKEHVFEVIDSADHKGSRHGACALCGR